jgi:hypothetical protein
VEELKRSWRGHSPSSRDLLSKCSQAIDKKKKKQLFLTL